MGNEAKGQTTLPAWHDQLPSDLKGHAELMQPEIGDAARAFIERGGKLKDSEGKLQEATEKLKSALFVPGADASEEVRAAYRKALGVPDKPEGYPLDKPKMPAEFTYNAEAESGFRKLCHDLNVSADTAKKLYAFANDLRAKEYEDFLKRSKEQRVERVKALHTAWGEKAEANAGKLSALAEKYGKDKAEKLAKAMLSEEGLFGDDPDAIELLLAIANDVLPDGLPGGKSREAATGGIRNPDIAARFPPKK